MEELPERPLAYLQKLGFSGPHDFGAPEPLTI